MTLTDVAVELYALPPAEFTAARNDRVRRLRADGDRDLARRVAALRRPTAPAWAVNLLVRHRPDDVERLLDLGGLLLRAQADRAGDRLRELDREQHARMAALREDARRLAGDAGQRLAGSVDVPLESTLRAAMTDPDAAAAVRSGLLVADLHSTGFGPVEVGDAVAVPGAPPLTGRAPAPTSGAHEDATARRRAEAAAEAAARAAARDRERERERAARDRERERAARDLDTAQTQATAAVSALVDAQAAVEHAEQERAAADADVARLAAALAEAQTRQGTTGRAEVAARSRRDAAAAAADGAARRADAARKHLAALDRPGPPALDGSGPPADGGRGRAGRAAR